MSSWNDKHLKLVSTMVRSGVSKNKHKQRQTIKGWCGGYDGDVLDNAIDDLIAAGIIRKKGRGTITLRSKSTGEKFLKQHDTNDDYVWFLGN